ncbi:uncharacterized protein LOC135818862 [Sycon ciliatum]|uniref:uncharacterized protein LOC135818862 n=1 Tax=Sycon ciliatum TaxID=27933 RepID=UPI0031F720D3
MMRPWCALLLVTCTVLSAVSDTGGAPDHLAIQRVSKTIECWRRPRGNNNEWPRSVPALYESTDNVWPDGEIIYQFFNYSLIPPYIVQRFHNTFRAAVRHIEERSCIRFIRAKCWPAIVYIKLDHTVEECWAHVGFGSGFLLISVGRSCVNDVGYLTHELLHTAGLVHTHQRIDRDQYVRILWENIRPDKYAQFEKTSQPSNISKIPDDMPYDYGSIMHYATSTFGINRTHATTIFPLQPGVEIGQRRGMSQIDARILNALYSEQCTFVNKTRPAQEYIQFEQRISIALPNRRWLRCKDSWGSHCERRTCRELHQPRRSTYGQCRASEFYLARTSGARPDVEEVLHSGDQVHLLVRRPIRDPSQRPWPLTCFGYTAWDIECRPMSDGPGTPLTVHALKTANAINATASRQQISETTKIALCYTLNNHYWCFQCAKLEIAVTHSCEPRLCDGGPDNCTISDPEDPVLIPMTIRQWRNDDHPNAVQYKRTISLRRGHGRSSGVHRYFHCENSSCSTEISPQCLRGDTYYTPFGASNPHTSQICDECVFLFMPENDVMPDDGLLRYEDTVSLVTARGQRRTLLCPSVNASCYLGSCPNNAKQCAASKFIVRQSAGFHPTTDDGRPVPSDDRVALCREASNQPLQFDLCLSCGRHSSASVDRLPCKLVKARRQDRNAFHASNFFVSQWRLPSP